MKFNSKDFFSFKKKITPNIIKWVYIVVSVLIVVAAVIGGFVSLVVSTVTGGVGGFFLGLLLFVVYFIGAALYLIFFRMFCEFIVVIFSIHTELKQINKKAGPMPDCCVEECAPAAVFNPVPIEVPPEE
jgi:hypothetical protein